MDACTHQDIDIDIDIGIDIDIDLDNTLNYLGSEMGRR